MPFRLEIDGGDDFVAHTLPEDANTSAGTLAFWEDSAVRIPMPVWELTWAVQIPESAALWDTDAVKTASECLKGSVRRDIARRVSRSNDGRTVALLSNTLTRLTLDTRRRSKIERARMCDDKMATMELDTTVSVCTPAAWARYCAAKERADV